MSVKSICTDIFSCKQPEKYLRGHLKVFVWKLKIFARTFFSCKQPTGARGLTCDHGDDRCGEFLIRKTFLLFLFLWRWSASAILSVKQLWWNLRIQDFWIWECCSASIAVQYWGGPLLENRLSNEVQPYNSYDWTSSLKYVTIKLKGDKTVFIMIKLFPRNVQNPYKSPLQQCEVWGPLSE